MRSLIAIFFTLLFTALTACESEFQKCLGAEKPRADKIVGLEESYDQLAQAKEFSKTLPKIINLTKTANETITDWEEQNPYPPGPKYPEYDCGDLNYYDLRACIDAQTPLKEQYQLDKEEHEQSNEVRSWWASKNSALAFLVPQFQELGVIGQSWEEIEQGVGEWDDSYDSLRNVRAAAFDCWGDANCNYPKGREITHLFGSPLDDSEERREKVRAWSELEGERLVEFFSSRNTATADKALELATLTCNRAGIYE